jgi:hypothetical protein
MDTFNVRTGRIGSISGKGIPVESSDFSMGAILLSPTFWLTGKRQTKSAFLNQGLATLRARSPVRGSVEHPRSLVAGRRRLGNDNVLYHNLSNISNIAHHEERGRFR